MTTSTPASTDPAIPTPPGAAYLGGWELSDDEPIARRWFHCGEHTTPGGLRVKVHGLQFVDGSLDGLGIAISDDQGDVSLSGADADALVADLRSAADELDQLGR
jgi:hypothetical protein